MKRIAWILLLSLLLLFVACNQGEDESTDNATDTAGQEKTEQRGWFEREPEPEQTEQPEVTEDTRQQERDKLEAQRKEEYGEIGRASCRERV